MKNNKWYVISTFVLGCIVINFAGRILSDRLQLPLWLDSFGTVTAAYVLGPFCAAMVGMTVNLTYGILYSWTNMFYAVVSAMVGITTGICVKKGFLKNLYGVLSTSFLIAVLSVTLSVPLNYLYCDGSTQNIWGDGVIESMEKVGFNSFFSHCMGQFYLDFLDKVITIVLVFSLIKLLQKKIVSKRQHTLLMMFLCILALGVIRGETVTAKTVTEQEDYSSYLQTVYGRENGIPGGCANDIVQTKDGVLWIGTYGGLYRYNGTKFQWINEYESIKTVNCLYTDEEGRLWVGTNDSGLSIFINDTVANVITEKQGLASDAVRCITQCADGNYYVGTAGALSIVTLAGGLNVKKTMEDIVYVKSMDADANGTVAAVTDDGKLYFIRQGKITDVVEPSEGADFSCCKFDENGLLYAGTSQNEILCYGCDTGEWKYRETKGCEELSNIKSLYFLDDGVMFVCADNGVGYFVEQTDFKMINTDTFNSSIDHVLMDYQGNLWFTSSRLGVLRLCKSVFTLLQTGAIQENQVVNSVTKWQNRFYIGTDSGLEVMDEETGEEYTDDITETLAGTRIRCLRTDSCGNLWICTTGKGIYEITAKGETFVYDNASGANGNKYRTVEELKNGTILAAGDAGLTFIRDGEITKVTGESDGLTIPKILCVLEQEDGTIFAGTDGNGIAVIKNGKVNDVYNKEDGLSSEVILRMVKNEDGGVFIVTSNGICYMDTEGKIRSLDKFPYYNNYDIVEGIDHTLFIPGSAGIYVVDKEDLLSGKELEYKLLNSDAGLNRALTPNAWNYVDENMNFYFSTDTGVICMDLKNYEVSVRSYRMQMKSVKIDDVSHFVRRGEVIYLERGAEKLEIFPEIINYSVNIPYVSVYLEGYDSEPQVVSQSEMSSVIYTNLPVGTYKFHIAVLDHKGQNPVVESVYTIEKKAEIYDHWWFVVYIVAVFTLAVAYLTWMIFHTQVQRVINLQKKEIELVKKQLEMGNETVLTIAKTVDAKDVRTSQHSERVAEYSVLIAKELGFDEKSCEDLKKAALLHDIGKIGIPDRILNKPEKLTDEEYGIMKSHVTKGAEILKSFTIVDHVEEGALYHHERYDGKGYVHGLKGEEIPINARIIGIADTFDAMTVNRVYRKQLDMAYVIQELKNGRGTQFDPGLVDVMLALIDNGKIDICSLYKEHVHADHSREKEEE